MSRKLTQVDAVEIAMKELGGFATFGALSSRALKVPGVEWATKTPFASIRRIVQVNPSRFFRIRPGLWALCEMRDQIPFAAAAAKPQSSEGQEFDHAYYQGLLVKLGGLQDKQTYVPLQDKNKRFLTEPLHTLTTVPKIYDFGYPSLVHQASSIDVVWFNDRKMPSHFFEVERSTDIQNSLVKFNELQDFHSDFRIVADSARQREYDSKLGKHTFKDIQQRVKFVSFDTVVAMYEKQEVLRAIVERW